jgi:hypothetical protein
VPGGLAWVRQRRGSGERARVLDFGHDVGRHGAFHLGIDRGADALTVTPDRVTLLPILEFALGAIADVVVERGTAMFAPTIGVENQKSRTLIIARAFDSLNRKSIAFIEIVAVAVCSMHPVRLCQVS